MNDVALFFAGCFLCNGLPHLLSGLQGTPFPTPFAKPRGIGNSSPLTNFLWGSFNLLLGLGLLAQHPLTLGYTPDFAALVFGFLVMGVFLSLHFGKVKSGRVAK